MLIGQLEAFGGLLPATLDSAWKSDRRATSASRAPRSSAVSGSGCYELTGERRFRTRASRRSSGRPSHQIADPSWADVDGALPGSFPVYGRYAPLAFPNWATKFLVDSLLMLERNTVPRSDAVPVA